jgi:Fe-S cluster biogenesis protein NfuA
MSTETFEERVKTILMEEISPRLQQDGGGVELVDIDENAKTVKVRFLGACRGCPMSQLTFASLVERTLKERIPEMEKVIPAI